MNLPSPRARRRARIEIIPLIDIIFFLLATFVMVSLSMVKSRGIRVNLPVAATAVLEEQSERVSLGVTERGELYWNREPIAPEVLGPRLRELAARTPGAQVILNGDADAHLGVAIGVLDQVREAGISAVAIETRPRP